ncbi:MAG TPA: hypothetical protein VM103_02065 [Candidatus Paceibacterota bacterium]|nr:hypothetical protein [Candidatus Paceibacterota bacterium]
MHFIPKQWEQRLNELQVLWSHSGNPKQPHALLTKGGHSNGFFNGGVLLFDHPRLARMMCEDLIERHFLQDLVRPAKLRVFLKDMANVEKLDRVIGPAFGAISLASTMADVLNVGYCFTVSKGDGKEKTFEVEKRFDVAGKVLLATEDTITTSDSIAKTIAAAEAKGAIVLPIVTAICNRSGLTHVGERPIIAFVNKPMENWAPDECPLCKAGSHAIRPKEAGNWAALSAPY